MGREADYTTDLNEITTGDIDSPILENDMHCPKLYSRGASNGRAFNWSSEQCKLRVREAAECTVKCRIGKQFREEMIAAGEDVSLARLHPEKEPKW